MDGRPIAGRATTQRHARFTSDEYAELDELGVYLEAQRLGRISIYPSRLKGMLSGQYLYWSFLGASCHSPAQILCGKNWV